MPFCPKCRGEFREDIAVCRECNVALVESLENEENEVEELDVACSVTEEENAYIIRGFLENEGIPCQIENVTFHAAPGGALTMVRLWTKKEDVEKARRLIDEHEKFNCCPSCGHVAGAHDTVCDFCGEELED